MLNSKISPLNSLGSTLLARKYLSALSAIACLALLLIGLHMTEYVDLRPQWAYSSIANKDPVAGGIPLRIMPLGASVVRGDVSSGNVGFRKPLRDQLIRLGNPVNMVGTDRVGDFKDNDVTAHPGNRVDQVEEWARKLVPQTKPNLFLINVGSNDCLQHKDLDNYYKRLNHLIDYLLTESPRATIILSTLLTNTVKNTEPCILNLNHQMRQLAPILEQQGKPVLLVEMHDRFVPNGSRLPRPHPSNITPDGTHPDDPGYAMLADIFLHEGIRVAESRGFLQRPEDVGIPDDGDRERDMEGEKADEEERKKMALELQKTVNRRWRQDPLLS